MSYTNRELLRLHVEAVWNIRLPPLTEEHVEILSGRPDVEEPNSSWLLYIGEVANNKIYIWQSGLDRTVQAALLKRADEALAPSNAGIILKGVGREVALHQVAQPSIDETTARRIARPIALQERALLETFQAGAAAYYCHADREPLIGVVEEGRLLCIAHSARRTPQACELGIETLPQVRRKGYALAATVLWAASVAREGVVPLYSALAENIASLKLAHVAGYRIFAKGTYLSS